MLIRLLNPALVFSIVWTTTLLLYILPIANVLLPLSGTAVLLVVGSCIAFWLPVALFLQVRPSLDTRVTAGSNIKYRGLRLFLFIWIGLSILEVSIAGSLPLFGVLGVGPYVRYTDFGIPSLHGFLNAILLAATNIMFHRYVLLRKRRYLIGFSMCMLWPVLTIHRQTLVSQVVQSFFIYLFLLRRQYMSRLRWRGVRIGRGVQAGRISVIVMGALFAFVVVYLFGILGDVRNLDSAEIAVLAQASEASSRIVPASVMWIYLYITAPLSNLIHNLDRLEPNYMPIASLAALSPTVVRDLVLAGFGRQYDWVLNVSYLNVSSFHEVFVRDFGVLGVLPLYMIFSTIGLFIYYKATTSPMICWQFVCVIVLHNIVLSVFANSFTSMVFMAQGGIHLLLQIWGNIKVRWNE